jgi:hypothetical protein
MLIYPLAVIPGQRPALDPEPKNTDQAGSDTTSASVVPAEAGIHPSTARTVEAWAPAFAGVTVWEWENSVFIGSGFDPAGRPGMTS